VKIWKVKSGQDLEIEAIFGPSATLAGQIVLSAPADVVLFSNPYHVKWLKLWRIVNQESQPNVFGYSPIVIVTRPDNPRGITCYRDLSLPGLRLVHGDPRTSGVGEWGVLAEYGSALLKSNDPNAAESQLQNIWHNVRLLGSSARESLTMFELGDSDAMITYEQEARLALERGVPLEIVIPTHTIISQHVAVIVDKNVSRREQPVLKAFMDFLVSSKGQEIFRRYHLRPAKLNDGRFPTLSQPYTVEDLGGWKRAYSEVIETIWQSEIEPGLDLVPNPIL
jgi:sulfate transport system substrate-binding protein